MCKPDYSKWDIDGLFITYDIMMSIVYGYWSLGKKEDAEYDLEKASEIKNEIKRRCEHGND